MFDAINAGISVARGNYADAALSMSAAVPIVGNVAGLAKIAKSAKKLVRKAVYKVRPPKRIGDLTRSEIKQIQNVVNAAGRLLEVVGSAARGTRRGIGSNLPIGKGSGTKSDIDILIPFSSRYHFKGLTSKLPDADVNIGTRIHTLVQVFALNLNK